MRFLGWKSRVSCNPVTSGWNRLLASYQQWRCFTSWSTNCSSVPRLNYHWGLYCSWIEVIETFSPTKKSVITCHLWLCVYVNWFFCFWAYKVDSLKFCYSKVSASNRYAVTKRTTHFQVCRNSGKVCIWDITSLCSFLSITFEKVRSKSATTTIGGK